MRRTLYDPKQRLPNWERGRPARLLIGSTFLCDKPVATARGSDTLQRLKRFLRSLSPTQRKLHTPSRLFVCRLTWRAFIKSHCDLRVQRGLDFHRNLRREKTK